MHDHGKSDSSVIPRKPPNKAERSGAEVVEGRELAKGRLREQNAGWTQSHTPEASNALQRIRAPGCYVLAVGYNRVLCQYRSVDSDDAPRLVIFAITPTG
jgi:hypothetical protein